MNFKGNLPQELIESLRKGRCILFVGSGISSTVERNDNHHLPDWHTFLLELLAYCESTGIKFWNGSQDIKEIISKGKYDVAAQEIIESMPNGEFSKFLTNTFNNPSIVPSKVHKQIFELPFRAIITTNYDSLLEGAYTLKNNGKTPSVFTNKDIAKIDSKLISNDFFIFKMHGDINRPDTIVLGNRSYDELIFRQREYLHFLESLFSTHVMLFVGFGGEDFDLDIILKKISAIYSRTSHKHYILLDSNKLNPTEKRRLLLDKKLSVIDYQYDIEHTQVPLFFKALYESLYNNHTSLDYKDSPIEERLLIITGKTYKNKNDFIGKALKRIFNEYTITYYYGLGEKDHYEIDIYLKKKRNTIVILDEVGLNLTSERDFFKRLIKLDEQQEIYLSIIGFPNVSIPQYLEKYTIRLTELSTSKLEVDLRQYLNLEEFRLKTFK